MTVLDSTPRDQYTASGGQTVFTYTFEIAAAGDIKVLQNGTLINQGAGAGEYAVSGVGVDTGGNVTLVTGATAGDILTIYRDMALERLTAYTNAGDFLAADVNNDFDRLWLALQQNGGDLDGRVLIAPNTDPTGIDMTIPDKATRLDKYLKFNVTTGNPEVADPTALFTSAGLNHYNFTGDGTTVNFTLGMVPGGENNTQVYIDGVYQQKNTYNVSGAIVQFSAAPPSLSTIEVMVIEVLPIGSTTASQVSFTQAGSTYGRNVQLKLQESVSVTDFGAIGDGVTDDTVAIQAADASSASQLSIPLGTYIVGTSITITTPIVGDGGILKPSSGVVITLSGDVRTSTLSQLFDISAGGSVKFTVAQDVYPEWWGTANTAIKSAMKSSAAGSRTVLQGKYYETVSIAFDNDPLASDGSDTAKSIEGVNPAQRYSTTGGFFGTRVKLADNQNTAVFTFASGGANSWGTGGLRNLMIEGNKGNQSAGDGIYIDDIKDIEFHNIYIWNCYANGMNLEGPSNQVSITGYMESWNNGNDGIRAAAMGDIQCTESTIRCVNNARYGFYIGTGSGRFNQIYAYFNTNSGIRIETSVDVDLHIDYIRSEDNDLAGLEIRGDNVHINHAYLSDNGYGGTTTGTKQAGVYLHSTSNNIVIDYLSSADRTAATHNQKFLMYDNSDSGCVVGTMSDRGIVNYAGAGTPRSGYFTNWATLAGCELRSAGVVVESYANLKDAGATLTPDPDRFSRYAVSAVSENMTVSNTANSSSPEGCTLALQLTSSGSYNVNWGSAYLSNAGGTLSANATTVGQVVNASFIRRAGKWYLEHAISVA